jgi:hypothetical protein
MNVSTPEATSDKKNEQRVFYIRNQHRQPLACVAPKRSEDGKSVKFALSICNPKDTFLRPTARVKAIARLQAKNPQDLRFVQEVELAENEPPKLQILSAITHMDSVPQRVRRAAFYEYDSLQLDIQLKALSAQEEEQ